jgi:septal ring factor EnvC (AmiA/AmiB activator)
MIEQSVPKIRDHISTAIPQIQSTLPRIELGITKAASDSSNMNQTLTSMSQDIGRVEANLNASREIQDLRMGLMQELLSGIHQSQSQQSARIGSLVCPKAD